eukprot:1997617-Rhodomonas_salina.1
MLRFLPNQQHTRGAREVYHVVCQRRTGSVPRYPCVSHVGSDTWGASGTWGERGTWGVGCDTWGVSGARGVWHVGCGTWGVARGVWHV